MRAWPRSGLSSTSVTETKPMRGSFISRLRMRLVSSLKSSRSRAMRGLVTGVPFRAGSPHLGAVVEHHEFPVTLELAGDTRQHGVGVTDLRADTGDREARAPPRILMRDLGRRHIEAVVHAVQHPFHDPAFVLDALRARKAALDAQHTNHHREASAARGVRLSRHRLHGEDLENVALLDVAEPLEPDATLEAFRHLTH